MQLLIFFLSNYSWIFRLYSSPSLLFGKDFGGLKWTFCYLVLCTNWQAHYRARVPCGTLVGSNGLGPSTSRLSGVCSNQLSYEPIYGGGNRVRTDDPLLAGQVLYQLSYTPIFSRSSQNKCPPCSREATLLKTNKKETIEFPID